MFKTAEAWRGGAAELGVIGRGGRYPAAMRRDAVRLCRVFQSGGGKVEEFAGRLGVPGSTLWTWLSRELARPTGAGALVQVKVLDEASPALVRLQLGGAHAAVSVEQLAELVRRLS